VFIVLGTFVGFTTSVFSASYIAHELETGRLTHAYLRFYHAMYQVLMFGMNLALLSNNVGLMWVAVELATLTTVLMVGSIARRRARSGMEVFPARQCRHRAALFGTILVYLAARAVVGEGLDAMAWSVLVERAADFDPALLNFRFVFLLLGYGTKVGLVPLHAWLPDAHAEGPTPISAVLSGLLLNVALFACCASRSSCRRTRGARSRAADGCARPAFGAVRVLHAVPARRHQAHVRLFVDRAHGDRHLRLRHGRRARQLRGPAAHDAA
jgi:hydrogenase-4 component F